MIHQGSELVFPDVILLLSISRTHTLRNIEKLLDIANAESLKLAFKKLFFMLLTVKSLGHEIGFITTRLIQSKVDAVHKIPSPTTKTELVRLISSMSFYFQITDKLHVNRKPLYGLLHDKI